MSSYILVIVESPAKCSKIEHYLNQYQHEHKHEHQHQHEHKHTYKCLASCGHIRELAGGLEGIHITNNFAPTFIECESKKEHIRKIRKSLKDAQEVIIATDADREGEAIAWHICEVFNLPVETTKRLRFHEITEIALKRAIEEPSRINMNIVQAQLARQILDILVGYKCSPLLWKHVQNGLSAGRCQTPALRLIYENQQAIDNKKGIEHYVITGYFTSKNIPFVLNYEEPNVKEFLQASIGHEHLFHIEPSKTLWKPAPKPFNTSTLQQAASNELHLSPKETMSVCQKLYEAGYITYHRTDNTGVPPVSPPLETGVPPVSPPLGKRSNDISSHTVPPPNGGLGGAPPAHEAIKPTNMACLLLDETQFTKKEARMYKLIHQRSLASGMPPAQISALTATISAPYNYVYRYTAEVIVSAGWMTVDDNKTNSHYAYFQTLKAGSKLPYKKIKAEVHMRDIGVHYSEARLVQLLDEQGIGRPSTFASIIDKIQERNYVKTENVVGKKVKCIEYELESAEVKTSVKEREFGNEKNKLIIKPIGILALDFLLKYFDTFFAFAYTQQMEAELDAVAQGTQVWHAICKKVNDELDLLSSNITERGKETIRIDANHIYMVGKHGPVVKCLGTAGRESTTFKPVKADLDLNKLRRGEYKLEDVEASAVEASAVEANSIGLYKDKPVYVKVGKYGKYIEWNNHTKSINTQVQVGNSSITLDAVADILFDMENTDAGILRVISPDASIRKGKYGDYIYYKNKKMKKPRFLKLDGLKDYLNCELAVLQEWFNTKYIA